MTAASATVTISCQLRAHHRFAIDAELVTRSLLARDSHPSPITYALAAFQTGRRAIVPDSSRTLPRKADRFLEADSTTRVPARGWARHRGFLAYGARNIRQTQSSLRYRCSTPGAR